MTRTTAPYGTWVSPITPASVAGNSKRFGSLQRGPDAVYWTEGRPQEKGRSVIVKCTHQGQKSDVIPAEFCARSRVHEYGGGEFSVWGERIFFVNDLDQDIYEVAGGTPRRITHTYDWRFSDICYDSQHNQLIVVVERHDTGAKLPVNLLASVALDEGGEDRIVILAEGRDFYASPRLSPGDKRLAYLCWDLPKMPWEAAELWLAERDDEGQFAVGRRVAGGEGSSVFQPEWCRDGSLIFIWDKSGWGNLYRWEENSSGAESKIIIAEEGDFGHPQWVFGMRSFALVGDDQLIVRYYKAGVLHLAVVDIRERRMRAVNLADMDIAGIEAIIGDEACAYMIISFHHQPPAIVKLDLTNDALEILAASTDVRLPDAVISVGEPVTFSSADGRTCYGIYYEPANGGYQAPVGELPPMIVSAHGGPTGMADRGLKLKIQYWTSRGFAYFDVDYTGSFGYGTAYRRALDGFWGVRDVADVVAGAEALSAQGRADLNRLFISGSSAGGYTVLFALVSSTTFAAGAAYYGISDLHKLAEFTHKFERGYIHGLMGTTENSYSQTFSERSPLYQAKKITSPVIFFQGSDDKVVPPEQSREMAGTLENNGVAVAYVEFSGEGHGFRNAVNIETALTSEYTFYARILNLPNCRALPPVEILNFGK